MMRGRQGAAEEKDRSGEQATQFVLMTPGPGVVRKQVLIASTNHTYTQRRTLPNGRGLHNTRTLTVLTVKIKSR